MKENIIDHWVNFKIDGTDDEFILSISFVNGLWSCTLLKGNTGMGNLSGGVYETLDDYIASCIDDHSFSYNFFYNR